MVLKHVAMEVPGDCVVVCNCGGKVVCNNQASILMVRSLIIIQPYRGVPIPMPSTLMMCVGVGVGAACMCEAYWFCEGLYEVCLCVCTLGNVCVSMLCCARCVCVQCQVQGSFGTVTEGEPGRHV